MNVNEVTKNLPSNMKRTTKKAIKHAQENQELKKTKSRFSQRFLSFVLGIAVSSGVACYYIHQTMDKTSNELESNIQVLQTDIAHEVNKFEVKLSEAENQFKN